MNPFHDFVVKDDSGAILSGALNIDSKSTIGEITDEYLYAEIPPEKIAELSGSKSAAITVHDIPFELPYACTETFRSVLEKTSKGNSR